MDATQSEVLDIFTRTRALLQGHFVLRSGLQVRLGDAGDLRLKLVVARRILAATGRRISDGYVDVSVPERPVVGPVNLKSEVEVEGYPARELRFPN